MNKTSIMKHFSELSLHAGDKIAIVSPSGAIDASYIDSAKQVFENWGLTVQVGSSAYLTYGRFGGTQDQRIADLQQALDDPSVKAVLCSRGGYGIVQIVDKLDFSKFKAHPKWVMGFSDVTVLHNAIGKLGLPSLHCIMAKHIAELDSSSDPVVKLKQVLFGDWSNYSLTSHPSNRNGIATGKLIGGNLSVFMGLRSTGIDLDFSGSILFLEEISEQPYHIDRMMQNLRISGVLGVLSGMVVGQFTDCVEDERMKMTVQEIILNAVSEYNFPVCFDFPSGHVDYNLPLILGTNIALDVNAQYVELNYL
jgi:muramoyltetrapeptide carboxypeptidase